MTVTERHSLTYQLANNYRIRSTITVMVGVPNATDISIVVYNVLGQKVRTLANGPVTAGFHEITWDGHNDQGTLVQSGVYFYRMQTGATALVKKMLFVK
jgi:flagellar hook assembly protein FlgD